MRKFLSITACIISLFIIIAINPSVVFTQDATAVNTATETVANLKTDSTVSTVVEKENEPASKTGRAATSVISDEGKNELSVWGGFAPDMPRVFGGSRPSSYGQLAVRYSRRIATSDYLALKYTVDFIPLAVINYDRRPIVQTGPNTFAVQSNSTTNYAFGLTPVGVQLHFGRRNKIQPFISANAGLLIFNKTIPDDRSTVFPDRNGKHLNFTLAGGGGVDFLTDSGRTFTVGFKFHHISNASSGNINPGFDQNLFYVGYTFKKW